MSISQFNKREHLEKCLEIYNEYANGEGIFKPLTKETFASKFCSKDYASIGFVYTCENKILGFAFGTVGEISGYISYVGVAKEHRRKGIGKKLLRELENAIASQNKNTERFDCMFYNPCQLPWLIPQNHSHSHPGTPGVDMESEGYLFFKSMGYADYAPQNAYYMKLSKLETTSASENAESVFEKVEKRKEKLLEMGIEITFYNKDLHYGFNELFDNIKNEGWRKSVMSRLDSPIVVATFNYEKCGKEYKKHINPSLFEGENSKKSLVIGYSGPLSVAEDGRGLFCGIGVHTDFRSAGIGKVIFYNLCLGLKNMGAEYMSLFTGNNNPARFVYEGTGFEIARTFSCMRKQIKKIT